MPRCSSCTCWPAIVASKSVGALRCAASGIRRRRPPGRALAHRSWGRPSRAPQREPSALSRLSTARFWRRGDGSLHVLPNVSSTRAPACWSTSRSEAVVLNLVVNALDAMPAAAGQRWSSDDTTPCSRSPTRQRRRRDPVRRVRPFFTTTRRYGLGLAIVRKLTEQHGGTVALRPAQGQGTTATVRLPRVASTK